MWLVIINVTYLRETCFPAELIAQVSEIFYCHFIKSKNISVTNNTQNNGYLGSFPGAKARPGRDADHSPPSSTDVVNE
jgi:hypothetical protein